MIKYTALSGQENIVSDDFRMYGLMVLWALAVSEKNERTAQFLYEAHSIMSAVLYGDIKKD
jgi:hypothetical protein